MYLIILGGNLTAAVGFTFGILLYLHQPIRLATLLRPAPGHSDRRRDADIHDSEFDPAQVSAASWHDPPAGVSAHDPVARWWSGSGLVVLERLHFVVDAGAGFSEPVIRICLGQPEAGAFVAPVLSAGSAAARDWDCAARSESGASALELARSWARLLVS